MKRRVVLAGGGHAHLSVLTGWANHHGDRDQRWLVTSGPFTAYSGMLPGWLEGNYRARDLFIDLRPLAAQAGAKLVLADAVGLDAAKSRLTLSSGDELDYDLLSIATGGEPDSASLAALGQRLIPAKPVPAFMERWEAFLAASRFVPCPHVGVVGGGAAGVELALAIHAALHRHFARGRVSLVSAEGQFLAGHAEGVRRRALAELGERGIAVHHATAVGTERGLILSDGSNLELDCVVAATGSRAPQWLGRSGLACNADGFILVGPDLRSRSHPMIFAAGDIVERTDRKVARSGVHAVKAGPVLAANLRAQLEGRPLRPYLPRRRTLYLLSTGGRRALLSWGPFVAAGKWVWRLKDWIDRHFIESHKPLGPSSELPLKE